LTDTSLFTADPADVVPQEVPPVVNPIISIPPELNELVGEGKKYKTVEAAMAALPHAQTHISKLEQELATLREEVTKRRTTQELLDELKSGIPNGETAPHKEIDQDAVVKLVKQIVSQTETVKQHKSNTSTVVSAFKEAFGDKAEEQYNKIAAEAGMSVGVLNELAKTSPLAVIKLAGLNKPVNITGKVKSDVNTETFRTNSQEPLSAKVAKTNSTRDLVDAWRRAGEKVKQNLG
jgi:hypothetical protein